ncbi:hypothetical protein GA0115252_14131, partial [Streptomyces sp. DfronAA-171]
MTPTVTGWYRLTQLRGVPRSWSRRPPAVASAAHAAAACGWVPLAGRAAQSSVTPLIQVASSAATVRKRPRAGPCAVTPAPGVAGRRGVARCVALGGLGAAGGGALQRGAVGRGRGRGCLGGRQQCRTGQQRHREGGDETHAGLLVRDWGFAPARAGARAHPSPVTGHGRRGSGVPARARVRARGRTAERAAACRATPARSVRRATRWPVCPSLWVEGGRACARAAHGRSGAVREARHGRQRVLAAARGHGGLLLGGGCSAPRRRCARRCGSGGCPGAGRSR